MEEYANIDNAIFDDPQYGIVRKRRNPVMGIVLQLLGAAGMIAYSNIDKSSPDLRAAILFSGVVLLIAGLIKLFVDLSVKSVPVVEATGKRLKRQMLTFDRDQLSRVKDYAREGDLESLKQLPQGNTSAIGVIVYSDPDQTPVIMQVHEYVPHNYRPVTGIYRIG